MPNQWLFKTEVKESTIHGQGRFALEDISIGKNVLTLDGAIVPKEQAPKKFPISLTHNMNCEDTSINHSEDPNLAYLGGTSFVSAKNIKIGEELTMDYREFAGDRKFLF
jgi:SET domain-containing protein